MPVRTLAVALAAVAWLSVSSSAQKTPIGPDFQVNTFTLNTQRLPAVATDADGDFVVAWDSFTQDGYAYGVFARRFSSTGDPQAVEFQVSIYTFQGQRVPDVAMEPDGDFVIVWRGGNNVLYEIFGRRFSSAGTALASEFQVNTYSPGQQINPAVSANASGDFIVAWLDVGQDGSLGGIFAQRFASTGTPNGGEFQVNSHTADYQRNPSIALHDTGAFVIAWQSDLQDGASFGVFAQRFSSGGAPLAAEFQVNAYTVSYQANPSAAPNPNGDFVITWESNLQNGGDYGIFLRRFSSAGVALSVELQVDTFTSARQRLPAVAADSQGDLIVVWHEYAPSGKEIRGRRFSSAGAPLTNSFQVNTYTVSYQQRPDVAARPDGDFIVVWESNTQDGSAYGIFGQRFAAITALDVDGNGGISPLTDGLLLLRYLFGFTGSTLTTGALGQGCTRCDATTIQAYLDLLGMVLDIDGNDALEPLTDGLLVLRYQFGFTGTALTNGATGSGCSRCDAASIEPYLLGLST